MVKSMTGVTCLFTLFALFRLGLNISSARLILLNGNGGTAAAGNVIEAFGTFVVGAVVFSTHEHRFAEQM